MEKFKGGGVEKQIPNHQGLRRYGNQAIGLGRRGGKGTKKISTTTKWKVYEENEPGREGGSRKGENKYS